MIESTPGQPDGILEFELSGRVTGDDYDRVLTPSIEAALEERDRIRLLCHFGEKFEGYELEAAWDDTKLGLRHWNAFDRVAIVTDVAWLRETIRAAGFILPCPVQVFANAELDAARRWLRESLGAIHLGYDESSGLLTAKLSGKLETSAYDDVAEQIDSWLAKQDHVRLLLDLRDFDGWQGLRALSDHLSLVRDHRHVPERVAIVGHSEWQKLAASLMSRFVNASVRYFAQEDFAKAESWLRSNS